MSASTDVIPRSEETDAEIELSAQDLLALADSRQADEPATRPSASPASTPKSAPRKLRLSLALLAAVGVIGSTYVLTSPESANPSTAQAPQHLAQSEWPATQQIAEGEPVRFANPFDAAEVFEFPAGTTQSQARDAVAEVLLKRAMSRQKS